MKKKVLFYTDTYLKYSETFIYDQLIGASSMNEVCILSNVKTNKKKFPFDHHIHLQFDLANEIQSLFDPHIFHWYYRMKVEKSIKKYNPDLIHAHFGYNAMKILPIAKKLNIPVLISFWGADASKRLKDERYERILKANFNNCYTVCCSKALRNNLKNNGFNTDKTGIHYAGVSIVQFDYQNRIPIALKIAKKEPVTFLQISRFVEKKGHVFTIRAFAEFIKGIEDAALFKLKFIGDGKLLSSMKKLVNDLKLENHIEFLGIKTSQEVITELANADLMLQHSVTASNGDMEGLPIVIIEAMATGLPVLSTYHSGIPELITNKENGFLINEKDHDAYVNALQEATQINEEIISKNARKTIEESFNLTNQNKRLNELYEAILDGSWDDKITDMTDQK